MKFISMIEQSSVIMRILKHLDLWEPLVTGNSGFLVDVGLFREVWSATGRSRRFIGMNWLFRENSRNGLKSRFLLLGFSRS